MGLFPLLLSDVLANESSERMISILSIGFVTMTILWVLSYFKSRKLKAKIKRLEAKNIS